jgi:hypothetical protein
MPSEPSAQVASGPQEIAGQPRRVVVGGMSWRDTFVALKHRNVRLFFVGQLVSLTGTWMQSTAQGWLVYQLTGSKVLLGTVAAVGTLIMLLLSLWGGSVADRHSKRTVVFYTQTGCRSPHPTSFMEPWASNASQFSNSARAPSLVFRTSPTISPPSHISTAPPSN